MIAIAYGNSLHGEWQFDDYPNIVENGNIQVRELSWQGMRQVPYFRERFQRPLAYLSFALNYRFGGLEVFGYHLVNLAIHLITSFFLFLFIFHTLQLHGQRDRLAVRAGSIALLATALWSISPVQVLAVSYIVQRMASLAGMFFIMALFFYLKGRTAHAPFWKGFFFTLFTLATLAAFGSKENTALLPATVFFYDLFLIQGISKENVAKNLKFLLVPATFVIILALLSTNLSIFTNGFVNREFTLWERVLTEGRVMIFYLSLLIYPLGERFTLLHDIDLSTSLIHPWTTIPAIALILMMLAYALWTAKKRPVLSFCIIAFFINHAIEGSALPLELVYEHRNYIPSMFFFMALAIVVVLLIERLSFKRPLQFLLAAGVACFLIIEGYTVHERNEILRSEKTLWLDNAAKAPNLSRPHSYLGKVYLKEGNYAAALDEFKEALRIARYGNLTQPAFDFFCLGSYFLNIADDADRAINYFQYALDHFGVLPELYNGLAVALLRKGNWQLAEANSRKALSYKGDSAAYHSNLALILLKEGKIDQATQEANRALLLDASYAPPLAVLGKIWQIRGDVRKSARYWENYIAREKEDISAYFALMELYARIEDKPQTINAIARFICRKGKQKTSDIIDSLTVRQNLLAYVPNKEVIKPLIKKYSDDLYL